MFRDSVDVKTLLPPKMLTTMQCHFTLLCLFSCFICRGLAISILDPRAYHIACSSSYISHRLISSPFVCCTSLCCQMSSLPFSTRIISHLPRHASKFLCVISAITFAITFQCSCVFVSQAFGMSPKECSKRDVTVAFGSVGVHGTLEKPSKRKQTHRRDQNRKLDE